MADPALLEGVATRTVNTPRLRTRLLSGGAVGGAPVFFVHGNVSSSRFFEPLDATRGLGDFSDDLYALVGALGLGTRKIHLVGWSMGGTIAVRYAMNHPDVVASLTLVNPMSPYGFGGTKDVSGIPCWPDYAGSGGGTTNPEGRRSQRGGSKLPPQRDERLLLQAPFQGTEGEGGGPPLLHALHEGGGGELPGGCDPF